MAKRPKDSSPKPPRPAPFNNPFAGLKVPKAPAPAARAAPPPRPAPPPKRDDEAELFLQAMDGVMPISERPPPPERPGVALPKVDVPRRLSDDAEALASLAELVSGEGSFDVAESDQFVQGSAPGLDRRVVAALRRGEYGVEARLDLHGLTRVEARDAVEQFLTRSRREGKRCVLIVHGRGLNSPDQLPVLKESVQGWLIQGRLGRGVLAFATARPQDGGAGAVYVLLRKGRG